jgi:hypothetical protein
MTNRATPVAPDEGHPNHVTAAWEILTALSRHLESRSGDAEGCAILLSAEESSFLLDGIIAAQETLRCALPPRGDQVSILEPWEIADPAHEVVFFVDVDGTRRELRDPAGRPRAVAAAEQHALLGAQVLARSMVPWGEDLLLVSDLRAPYIRRWNVPASVVGKRSIWGPALLGPGVLLEPGWHRMVCDKG